MGWSISMRVVHVRSGLNHVTNRVIYGQPCMRVSSFATSSSLFVNVKATFSFHGVRSGDILLIDNSYACYTALTCHHINPIIGPLIM